jgi:hypothetical protein
MKNRYIDVKPMWYVVPRSIYFFPIVIHTRYSDPEKCFGKYPFSRKLYEDHCIGYAGIV